MADIRDSDDPPARHSPGESLDSLLCRVMRVALRCYDEVAAADSPTRTVRTDPREWTDYDTVWSYEVVHVDAGNAAMEGFGPDQFGLKVRYDSYWVADVADLAEARAIIGWASGVPGVVLVDDHDAHTFRWVPERPDDVSDDRDPTGTGS